MAAPRIEVDDLGCGRTSRRGHDGEAAVGPAVDADASGRVASASARLGFECAEHLATTHSSVVVAGRWRDRNAVLKIPRAGSDEGWGGRALRHYGGVGAARLLHRHRSGAMIIERACPGTPLSSLVAEGRDEEAVIHFCTVARDLLSVRPPQRGFPTTRDWAQEIDRYSATGDRSVNARLVARAREIFADLDGAGASRLLHGDLHHDNIVLSQRGWLAIDPKGVVGDPALEPAVFLHNPGDDPASFADREIFLRRIDILAHSLALDRQRIIAWAFWRSVLAAIRDVRDRSDPWRGLIGAEVAAGLL